MAAIPLDVVSALPELAPESSALSAFPQPLHTFARLLDELPPTLLLTYTEAKDAVHQLVAQLDGAV